MEFLKIILNWVKLFLAFDFIGVAIFLPFSAQHEFKGHPERYWIMLFIQLFFLTIGMLLFFWFLKARNKSSITQVNSTNYESSFYRSYPKFVQLVENWQFSAFGTDYYTYSQQQADESLEAIKWMRISIFPIIPLYQEKFSKFADDSQHQVAITSSHKHLKKFNFAQRIPINKRLIIWTFLFYYLFLLPAILLPLFLMITFKNEILGTFTGPSFWIVIALYLCWGIFLLSLSHFFSKKLFLNAYSH